MDRCGWAVGFFFFFLRAKVHCIHICMLLLTFLYCMYCITCVNQSENLVDPPNTAPQFNSHASITTPERLIFLFIFEKHASSPGQLRTTRLGLEQRHGRKGKEKERKKNFSTHHIMSSLHLPNHSFHALS